MKIRQKNTSIEAPQSTNALKVMVILAGILILFPIISAATELTFGFNTEFDLKRPCFNNGSFCSAATECNITITDPNGNVIVDNQLMTNQVSFHNYTVSSALNNQLGIHPSYMSCNDSGLGGGDTFEIEITADGRSSSIFPTQFVIMLLGFALIGFGLSRERMRLFKHVGSILVFIMGVLTLYPGYSLINYSTLLGKGLGFACIGLGFYFLIEDGFSRDEQTESFQSKNEEYEEDDGRIHE